MRVCLRGIDCVSSLLFSSPCRHLWHITFNLTESYHIVQHHISFYGTISRYLSPSTSFHYTSLHMVVIDFSSYPFRSRHGIQHCQWVAEGTSWGIFFRNSALSSGESEERSFRSKVRQRVLHLEWR